MLAKKKKFVRTLNYYDFLSYRVVKWKEIRKVAPGFWSLEMGWALLALYPGCSCVELSYCLLAFSYSCGCGCLDS